MNFNRVKYLPRRLQSIDFEAIYQNQLAKNKNFTNL